MQAVIISLQLYTDTQSKVGEKLEQMIQSMCYLTSRDISSIDSCPSHDMPAVLD